MLYYAPSVDKQGVGDGDWWLVSGNCTMQRPTQHTGSYFMPNFAILLNVSQNLISLLKIVWDSSPLHWSDINRSARFLHKIPQLLSYTHLIYSNVLWNVNCSVGTWGNWEWLVAKMDGWMDVNGCCLRLLALLLIFFCVLLVEL